MPKANKVFQDFETFVRLTYKFKLIRKLIFIFF